MIRTLVLVLETTLQEQVIITGHLQAPQTLTALKHTTTHCQCQQPAYIYNNLQVNLGSLHISQNRSVTIYETTAQSEYSSPRNMQIGIICLLKSTRYIYFGSPRRNHFNINTIFISSYGYLGWCLTYDPWVFGKKPVVQHVHCNLRLPHCHVGLQQHEEVT